jgi:hypothetical protein
MRAGGTTAESDETASAQNQGSKPKRKLTVADIKPNEVVEGDIFDIEDNVYRIFNKINFEKDGKARQSRTVVFGAEGGTVRSVLWDKAAEMVDAALLQRRDRALATNMRVKKTDDEVELYSTNTTYLSRLAPSRSAISDLTQLKGDERNIDIVGRVVSVGGIKLFKGLGGREGGVSECTITDGRITVRVALWGSSSSYAPSIHPGDYLKLEFVSVKATANGTDITSNDSSRLLISRAPFQT